MKVTSHWQRDWSCSNSPNISHWTTSCPSAADKILCGFLSSLRVGADGETSSKHNLMQLTVSAAVFDMYRLSGSQWRRRGDRARHFSSVSCYWSHCEKTAELSTHFRDNAVLIGHERQWNTQRVFGKRQWGTFMQASTVKIRENSIFPT